MQIDLYTEAGSLDHLRGAWNELLHQSDSDVVFMTWEWQKVWWQHFGPAGDDPLYLITLRNADQELVGLWPLYNETPGKLPRRLRVIGSPRGSDYLDLIACRGRETTVHAEILDFLAAQDDWESVEITNIQEDSPTLQVLACLAETQGFDVHVEPVAVCPRILLPDSWAAYLRQLRGKQRHEIRRKLRRAEQGMEHVEWYLSEDPRTLPQDVTVYLDLFQKSSPVKEEYLNEERQQFFQAMASVMLEAGWLYLAFITVNDEKVASLFCFDYANRISVYNSGYDPRQYHHLSPGIVLVCYCIQDAIGRGYPIFDFLRGDEEYKYRFGAADRGIHRLTIRRG